MRAGSIRYVSLSTFIVAVIPIVTTTYSTELLFPLRTVSGALFRRLQFMKLK